VVTVHDLIALRLAIGEIGPGELPRSSTWFQFWNAKSLDGARTIVCVSRKTLRDCQHILKRPHKYLVVSNPVDPAFAALEAVSPVPSLPPRYLLHVGNSFFYKNRPAVMRIFSALGQIMANPPELVMMGSPLTFEEKTLARELGISSRLHFYAGAPDSWLKTAYQKAEVLVFPSLDEGFGWPVLEALSLGCPVFATHREPFTEVGGDAAEYIDPGRPKQAAEKIAAFLQQSPEGKARRIEEGRKRAAEFSMRRFAESLERAYAVASGALPQVEQ
jgi:glycosyltransferase involved in cell wall biosynthesis